MKKSTLSSSIQIDRVYICQKSYPPACSKSLVLGMRPQSLIHKLNRKIAASYSYHNQIDQFLSSGSTPIPRTHSLRKVPDTSQYAMHVFEDSFKFWLTCIMKFWVDRGTKTGMEYSSILREVNMVLNGWDITPLKSPWIFVRRLVFSINCANSLEIVSASNFSWV